MNKITFWKIFGRSLGYFMLGVIALLVFLMCIVPVAHLIITGIRNGKDAVFLDYFFYSLLIIPSFFMFWISFMFFRLSIRIIFNKKERESVF